MSHRCNVSVHHSLFNAALSPHLTQAEIAAQQKKGLAPINKVGGDLIKVAIKETVTMSKYIWLRLFF